MLARASKPIVQVRRAASDDLWVVTSDGTLERITATTSTPIATPEAVLDLDGVDRGGAWILGRSGKVFRRAGEQWKPMPMPAPPFSSGAVLKAESIVVAAPDDVLVTATYWEKGPSWKDQELHSTLFRTKRVNETLRCNEPDPENNNIQLGQGFQSWPPMATAGCKTPFAVLARRSKAIKNDDDWPKPRASLEGHSGLGDVSLVDFVSGDRTFVGVKTKGPRRGEGDRREERPAAAGDRLRRAGAEADARGRPRHRRRHARAPSSRRTPSPSTPRRRGPRCRASSVT